MFCLYWSHPGIDLSKIEIHKWWLCRPAVWLEDEVGSSTWNCNDMLRTWGTVMIIVMIIMGDHDMIWGTVMVAVLIIMIAMMMMMMALMAMIIVNYRYIHTLYIHIWAILQRCNDMLRTFRACLIPIVVLIRDPHLPNVISDQDILKCSSHWKNQER